MATDKDLLRQAYMDGELSVEEIIRFESERSEEEFRALQAEQAFESVLIEKLEADCACPDELWQDIQNRIAASQRQPQTRRLVLWLAALAAVVTIVAGLLPGGNARSLLFHSELAAVKDRIEVPGDWQKIRSSLTEHGFHLALTEPGTDAYHKIELYGLLYHDLAGEQVAEVCFTCCGEPISVYLSKDQDVDLTQLVDFPASTFRHSSPIDKYQVLAVGGHSPTEILSLFS